MVGLDVVHTTPAQAQDSADEEPWVPLGSLLAFLLLSTLDFQRVLLLTESSPVCAWRLVGRCGIVMDRIPAPT